MTDSPKLDPLASLQLPAIPLVPGVDRKPYRRGTYEAARLRRERLRKERR